MVPEWKKDQTIEDKKTYIHFLREFEKDIGEFVTRKTGKTGKTGKTKKQLIDANNKEKTIELRENDVHQFYIWVRIINKYKKEYLKSREYFRVYKGEIFAIVWWPDISSYDIEVRKYTLEETMEYANREKLREGLSWLGKIIRIINN